METEYPFEWMELTEVEKAEHAEFYPSESSIMNPAVFSNPLRVCLPPKAIPVLQRIYKMKPRPDDVWIVTFPKCGTTWTTELVWQIVTNADQAGQGTKPLGLRVPFVELEGIVEDKPYFDFPQNPDLERQLAKATFESFDFTENFPSPRVIKTHIPVSMLPPNILETSKVIFVGRNPMDTCVSFYHHTILFNDVYKFEGDLKTFCKAFMKGQVQYGDYWAFIKDGWKYRGHPNFRFLWYETMKKDLISVIRDLSSFLGYHLTELRVLTIDDRMFIKNYRSNVTNSMKGENAKKKIEGFLRKGEVGDWKNYLDGELLDQWKKWIKDNLEGTEIEIQYD